MVFGEIMKSVFLFLILFSSQSFAEKTISLPAIGFGKQINISTQIQLPQGQKLNKAAPSKITVFEKEGTGWNLTEEIDLNSFFSLNELIQFQRPVQLKSEKSDIKIEANLYHCPRFGKGICVIDDFVGIIQRKKDKLSSEIKLSLAGSPPK